MKRTLSVVVISTLLACICLGCTPSAIPGQANPATSNTTASAPPSGKPVAKPLANPPPAPANPNAPAIKTFVSTPSIVYEGGTSVLTWEVSKATSVSIGPSVGPVSTLGNVRVSPETSTTYTLTAANSQGTVTAIATVMVEKPHSTLAPVVLDFSANPRMISENDSCTLTWNIYGADSVNISLGSGKTKVTISDKLTPTGTMTVFPLYTLTASEIKAIPTVTTVPSTSVYTLTATNIAGTTTLTTDVTVLRTAILPKPGIPLAQDNITVVAATALPMIRWLSSNPITVVQGNPAILSWEVAQATKVLLNGVQVPFSGSQVINPATAATYTITANNDYWGYSKGLTVGVLAYNAQWFKPLVR